MTQKPAAPRSRMWWGLAVRTLGALWLAFGILGFTRNLPLWWLYAFCGFVLFRMGGNLLRRGQG